MCLRFFLESHRPTHGKCRAVLRSGLSSVGGKLALGVRSLEADSRIADTLCAFYSEKR